MTYTHVRFEQDGERTYCYDAFNSDPLGLIEFGGAIDSPIFSANQSACFIVNELTDIQHFMQELQDTNNHEEKD